MARAEGRRIACRVGIGGRMRLPTRAGMVVLLLTALIPAASAPAERPAAGARARDELREVLQASADTADGARLFAICTECHGARGEGNANGWPPQIAAQHSRVIAKELIDFRTGLRWY